jgi:sugar lactone lactonase YvrE
MNVSELIGSIVLCEDGTLIAMEKNMLVRINFDKQEEVLISKLEIEECMRFNDGKCDEYGRLWVGTMAMNQDNDMARNSGNLFCLEFDERSELTKVKQKHKLEGYTIPNGLAWSLNYKQFYHIDTVLHRIDIYDVTEDGGIYNRRSLIKIPDSEGAPDGMCIDADGNLWVAMWGGSKVICYQPSTGTKLEEIIVPTKYVTCCTFGGEDMQTLFITTAKNGQKSGGNLYGVHLNMKGIKPSRCSSVN